MARRKTTAPNISRETGQRSITYPPYLNRLPTPFPLTQPEWIRANAWRGIVYRQPVCMDCREFLISSILDLEWKIEAKDSTKRDELKSEIEYYTDLLKSHNEYRYSHVIEWIGRDLLDLPFGAAMELGREGDSETGKVLWYELLDGATCYPTLNDTYPVGQKYADAEVYFPKYAINRVYMSPRSELHKRGWGMPPPEKIYLALEMINRGDTYYANLLLDTPPTGILDLVDMSKDSAEKWVKAWQSLLAGIDPYKIPVLYEHEAPAEWIDFTRSPTEIMFDVAVSKYAALVASGYGISLSDIGLGGSSSGGNTLAGTIREERSTRRSGQARLKTKFREFFNNILPKTLEFKFIDLDEETSVALGRARLASSTAAGAWINNKMFSPEEMRQQAVADGLISIPVPEKVPDDSEFPDPAGGTAERPSMMGKPVSPSSGGFGEVAARSEFEKYIDENFRSLDEITLRRLMYKIHPILSEEVRGVRETLEDELLSVWGDWYEKFIWDDIEGDTSIPELDMTIQDLIVESLLDEVPVKIDSEVHTRFVTDLCSFVQNTLHTISMRDNNHRVIRGDETKEALALDSLQAIDLDKFLEDKTKKIPLYMSRAIVSATRHYLLLNEANFDAERIVTDGDASNLARWYIDKALNVLISEISQEISDIITKIVKGEIENGSKEKAG